MTVDRKRRIEKVLPKLERSLEECRLCRHSCGVNRIKGEKGFCLAPKDPVIYTWLAHRGEEPPISGQKGSGTIFFSYCVMRCLYCQNWKFSQTGKGSVFSSSSLADCMLRLEEAGCHNINLVSPTHFVPGILKAVLAALEGGLGIPIVYNTGGYDSLETIKALDGIIDIYLPDMRYARDEAAVKYSSAPGYVGNNRKIILEMKKQVDGLRTDEQGLARKGLIIRLLVLPGDASGTEDTLEFISKMDKNTCLSVMSQYYPAYKAGRCEGMSRRITRPEYDRVLKKMEELGLEKGWVQPFEGGFDLSLAGENLIDNRADV